MFFNIFFAYYIFYNKNIYKDRLTTRHTSGVFNNTETLYMVFFMRCPFCLNQETCVIETRESDEDTTRRRRQCLKCRKRFTTYERLENNNLRVIKKDGSREFFDREKVRRGILKACEKRPISTEQIGDLVRRIENTLRRKHAPEIKSSIIGNLVIRKLKNLDSVAYIRFASVYREFADLSDLQEEIKKLTWQENNRRKKKPRKKFSKNKKRSNRKNREKKAAKK